MMPNLPIVEIIAILTMAISVPSLAMACWHGWKFEQHKAEQNAAAIKEERP
jgi:hypothetical protein